MELTRRDVLRGITTTGTIALVAESRSFSSVSAAPAESSSVPWPESHGSPVIDSLRPVIERSRDVRTNHDKVKEVASWMAYEELPLPNLAVPFGMEKTPDVAIDFIMVGNAIDTAFTDFKSHVKFQIDYAGEHHSDSDAMFACLKRAMDNGSPVLDGAFLAKLSRDNMAKIFAGNIEMPMLDEKLDLFHQVGGVLAAKYGGHFYNFIKSCSPKLYDNGKGLVERLAAEFPRFNDVSEYDGHSIKIFKLTQLGYWQLYTGLRGTGAFKLEDPQKMTAFADYIVPVGLRLMGITSYSPQLEKAINTYQMIPRDSKWEIEIRAHCLYATALLTDEINKIRPAAEQVIIPQIDARFWTHFHTTDWPHHLTKTIMY